MWDCHAHLLSKEFSPDLDAILNAASLVGVSNIVCVSESLEEAKQLALHRFEIDTSLNVHKCFGIHPEFAQVEDIEPFISFFQHHSEMAIGIGECGLDFSPHIIHEDETKKQAQRAVFDAQVNTTGYIF